MPFCAARFCPKKGGEIRKYSVSFHQFPQDEALRKLWIKNVCEPSFEPNYKARICSNHFLPGCFEPSYELHKQFGLTDTPSGQAMRRRLKPDTYPTIKCYPRHSPRCNDKSDEKKQDSAQSESKNKDTGKTTEKKTLPNDKGNSTTMNTLLPEGVRAVITLTDIKSTSAERINITDSLKITGLEKGIKVVATGMESTSSYSSETKDTIDSLKITSSEKGIKVVAAGMESTSSHSSETIDTIDSLKISITDPEKDLVKVFYFSETEENVIADHCIHMDLIGRSYTRWQVLLITGVLLKILGRTSALSSNDKTPSRQWFYGFLGRHLLLKDCFAPSLHKKTYSTFSRCIAVVLEDHAQLPICKWKNQIGPICRILRFIKTFCLNPNNSEEKKRSRKEQKKGRVIYSPNSRNKDVLKDYQGHSTCPPTSVSSTLTSMSSTLTSVSSTLTSALSTPTSLSPTDSTVTETLNPKTRKSAEIRQTRNNTESKKIDSNSLHDRKAKRLTKIVQNRNIAESKKIDDDNSEVGRSCFQGKSRCKQSPVKSIDRNLSVTVKTKRKNCKSNETEHPSDINIDDAEMEGRLIHRGKETRSSKVRAASDKLGVFLKSKNKESLGSETLNLTKDYLTSISSKQDRSLNQREKAPETMTALFAGKKRACSVIVNDIVSKKRRRESVVQTSGKMLAGKETPDKNGSISGSCVIATKKTGRILGCMSVKPIISNVRSSSTCTSPSVKPKSPLSVKSAKRPAPSETQDGSKIKKNGCNVTLPDVIFKIHLKRGSALPVEQNSKTFDKKKDVPTLVEACPPSNSTMPVEPNSETIDRENNLSTSAASCPQLNGMVPAEHNSETLVEACPPSNSTVQVEPNSEMFDGPMILNSFSLQGKFIDFDEIESGNTVLQFEESSQLLSRNALNNVESANTVSGTERGVKHQAITHSKESSGKPFVLDPCSEIANVVVEREIAESSTSAPIKIPLDMTVENICTSKESLTDCISQSMENQTEEKSLLNCGGNVTKHTIDSFAFDQYRKKFGNMGSVSTPAGRTDSSFLLSQKEEKDLVDHVESMNARGLTYSQSQFLALAGALMSACGKYDVLCADDLPLSHWLSYFRNRYPIVTTWIAFPKRGRPKGSQKGKPVHAPLVPNFLENLKELENENQILDNDHKSLPVNSELFLKSFANKFFDANLNRSYRWNRRILSRKEEKDLVDHVESMNARGLTYSQSQFLALAGALMKACVKYDVLRTNDFPQSRWIVYFRNRYPRVSNWIAFRKRGRPKCSLKGKPVHVDPPPETGIPNFFENLKELKGENQIWDRDRELPVNSEVFLKSFAYKFFEDDLERIDLDSVDLDSVDLECHDNLKPITPAKELSIFSQAFDRDKTDPVPVGLYAVSAVAPKPKEPGQSLPYRVRKIKQIEKQPLMVFDKMKTGKKQNKKLKSMTVTQVREARDVSSKNEALNKSLFGDNFGVFGDNFPANLCASKHSVTEFELSVPESLTAIDTCNGEIPSFWKGNNLGKANKDNLPDSSWIQEHLQKSEKVRKNVNPVKSSFKKPSAKKKREAKQTNSGKLKGVPAKQRKLAITVSNKLKNSCVNKIKQTNGHSKFCEKQKGKKIVSRPGYSRGLTKIRNGADEPFLKSRFKERTSEFINRQTHSYDHFSVSNMPLELPKPTGKANDKDIAISKLNSKANDKDIAISKPDGICKANDEENAAVESQTNKTKLQDVVPRAVWKPTSKTLRYDCPGCKQSIGDLKTTEKHMDYCDKINRCNKCLLRFSCENMWAHHVKNFHLEPKSYQCHICDETFTESTFLWCHVTSHVSSRCHICDRELWDHRELQSHMTQHTGKHFEAYDRYFCFRCNRKVTNDNNLRQYTWRKHLASHLKGKVFKCSQCQCRFNDIELLSKHVHEHTVSQMKSAKSSI